MTCIYASGLFKLLRENGQLFKFQNPRNVFSQVFKQKLTEKNNTACILDDKCKDGHSFQSFVEMISVSMFIIMSNNVVSEMNSEIHAGKRRSNVSKSKRDPTTTKIRKVTSN